jgi:AcrR family transcriptional regulator
MEQNARAKILNAAEARLLSTGPAGLVLDAVAADAGISKGGLLYHFPNKEALVGGLCDRMLGRFDEELTSLSTADPERPGAWTRAYLTSTVTEEGKPADNSAELMAGILATLGRDSVHLDKIREHFVRWHVRLESDGIDPTTAKLVCLAADGLWLSALLGLQQIDPEPSSKVFRALRDMTRR